MSFLYSLLLLFNFFSWLFYLEEDLYFCIGGGDSHLLYNDEFLLLGLLRFLTVLRGLWIKEALELDELHFLLQKVACWEFILLGSNFEIC